MNALRDKIVGSCITCGGDGYNGQSLCACSIKFRVYNRLVSGGFNEEVLDFISSPAYSLPMMEAGAESVEYFIHNPFPVLEKGLSLFIYSKENGRGKSTLAHYLAYVLAWPFAHTENYSRDRSYAFVDMHKLMEEFDDDAFDAWKATLLVIDDLGSENRSGWRKESAVAMLHRIMHFRRDKKLPTIITANYGPDSLSGFYNGILDSVLEVRPDGEIGGKLFRQIEVGGGEDFRLSPETTEWPE
jgi:hypothetical protein